jgi:hypothetical protein
VIQRLGSYIRLGRLVGKRLHGSPRRDEIVTHLIRLIQDGHVVEAEWIGIGKDLGLING